MAGQRAALLEAFQLMLPGQQQLGSMASNLQRLQSQVHIPACLARGPIAGLCSYRKVQNIRKACSWLIVEPRVMGLSRTLKSDRLKSCAYLCPFLICSRGEQLSRMIAVSGSGLTSHLAVLQLDSYVAETLLANSTIAVILHIQLRKTRS